MPVRGGRKAHTMVVRARVQMPPAKAVATMPFWRALKVRDLSMLSAGPDSDAALVKCSRELMRDAVDRGAV